MLHVTLNTGKMLLLKHVKPVLQIVMIVPKLMIVQNVLGNPKLPQLEIMLHIKRKQLNVTQNFQEDVLVIKLQLVEHV